MKSKPMIFNILGLFFLGVALSLPLQVGFLYENDLTTMKDWHSIIIKLTPLNYLIMGLCLVNSYFAFTVKPFLKYTVLISVILVSLNNYIVGSWGMDFAPLTTWFATLFFAAISYSFSFFHGSEAIDHPDQQWWKVAPRYNKTFPVWIEWNGKKKVLTTTHDISKTGAFVSTINDHTQALVHDLPIGEKVRLSIGTNNGELRLEGVVVRKEAKNRGQYPQGLGIKFNPMNPLHNLRLRGILTNIGAI